MRILPLVLLAAEVAYATAQQPAQQLVQAPPAGSNWQNVEALPAGTSIYVSTTARTMSCTLTKVNAESLACTHGKATVFQRTEIATIKLPRRTRSSAILAGIGAGVGIGVVKATSAAIGFKGAAKGSVCAGGAGAGAVLFAPIGFAADPTRSTVYKAP
jgi:hypothetical protein